MMRYQKILYWLLFLLALAFPAAIVIQAVTR